MPAKKKQPVKPAKRGPKPRVIDYDQVERLAMIQCPDSEIAYVIGFTPEGFCKRKQSDPELVQRLEKGKEGGRASLRRMQFKAAEGGDKTMLVWLGKQYLGQRDKQDVEHTGPISVQIVKPDRTHD